MTEFAYSGLGLNPHWGTPGNAVARDRIPGGSSSGAGVTVALGVADVAIGTDTGGSVRIPASLNGVVGFKPTAGRIPRHGVFPLSPSHDLASVLSHTRSRRAPMPTRSWRGRLRRSSRPLRWPAFDLPSRRTFWRTPSRRCCKRSVSSCAPWSANAPLCRRRASADLVAEMRAVLTDAPIVPFEAAQIHGERVATRPDEFDPQVLARIRSGQTGRRTAISPVPSPSRIASLPRWISG